jgi:4-hydroxy-4-methyl-2-oxoglutarate aldolase
VTQDPLAVRLAALDACIVSDALERLALPGTVHGIHRVWPCPPIAGRVITVQLGPYEETAAAQAPHLGARAVEAAAPGDVIVIANDGRIEMAAWGGLLSLAASRRQAGGTIVDGACRDVDESEELRYPVFARTAVPTTARGRVMELATNVEVRVSDVLVEPGDLVIADGSGVVFVSGADAEEVLDVAEELQAREGGIAERLRAGGTPTEVMGRHYERLLAPDDR